MVINAYQIRRNFVMESYSQRNNTSKGWLSPSDIAVEINSLILITIILIT
jgi:hypothetical protein